MRYLFLMDPLSTVNIKKDTSFAFMEAAHERGHEVYYVPKGGIALDRGNVLFTATPAQPQRVAEQPYITGAPVRLTDADVDAVFIRPDPPFDDEYLMNTWLLDQATRRTLVINQPSGVRTVNEKLWATQFTDLIPRTLITRAKADYLDFLAREGDVIVKPTNGHGGKSVFRVRQGDLNANVVFETLSNMGQVEVVVQEYLSAAAEGDKRILLLNGDYLGAVLRVHGEDDHRNNFFAGGHAEEAVITPREREIIAALAPHLRKLGLWFVGIDIIGDRLVEVNVTSPTGIQEASAFAGERLADRVIDFVESGPLTV
ncbi:MAG: glutathione synthase [Caldilineaceae bacterium]|nr:glutathione synthase [Caldilineaceae bacterium]